MEYVTKYGEFFGVLSSLVIIAGLPVTIVFYFLDRKQRQDNEVDEIYIMLGNAYFEFLKLTLAVPELNIWDKHDNVGLDSRQLGQKWALFDFLVSLFERAYIFSYEHGNVGEKAWRWRSWETFMREWCERSDFSEWLPELVRDEDAKFAAFILSLLRDVQINPRNRFGTLPEGAAAQTQH